MKKRIFSCLLSLILILTLSAGVLAAPELTVDGDGRIEGSAETDGQLTIASYDPETGRFLGFRHSGETVGSADVLLKALETDENYNPLNESRSVLVVTEPGSSYEGGCYDAVVVTGAVGSGAVTLKNASVTDLILCGGGEVTLDGVDVSGTLEVRMEQAALMDGEPGAPAGITIKNSSSVGSIRICGTAEEGIYLRTEEGCRVDVVYTEGGGDVIFLEGVYNQVVVETDVPVVLTGATVTGVTVKAENASVTLEEETRVDAVQIDAGAEGASLEAGEGTRVNSLEARGENAAISGGGQIVTAQVSGSGTEFNVTGTVLTVEEGTGGVTENGQSVAGGETRITGSHGGGTEPQPAGHVHTWIQTVVTEPALGSVGETVFTCADCGETRKAAVTYMPYRVSVNDIEYNYQTLESAMAAVEGIWLEDDGPFLQHPTIRLTGMDAVGELRLPRGFELDIAGGSLAVMSQQCAFGSAKFREPGDFGSGLIQDARLRLHPQEGSALSLGDLTVCGVGDPETWLLSTDGEDPEAILTGGIVPDEEYGLPRLQLWGGLFELRVDIPAGVFSVLVTDGSRGWTEVFVRADVSLSGVLVGMDTKLTVFHEGSLTLSGRSDISGEAEVRGSLVNAGSMELRAYDVVYNEGDEPDYRFGSLEIQDGGSVENSGYLHMECIRFMQDDWEDGRFAEFRICGDAVFTNTGSIENDGFLYVWRGGSLVNEGILLNRELLQGDCQEELWDTYTGAEPVLAAVSRASSIDNSGVLVNERSVNLNGAGMTNTGVFTNRSDCYVSSALQVKLTRTLEFREGDPGEYDEWDSFVRWEENGYWHTVEETREVLGVYPAALAVKDGGLLDNYRSIQVCNGVLDVGPGGTLNNREHIGLEDQGDSQAWWSDDPHAAMNGFALPAPEILVEGTLNNGVLTGVGEEFSGSWGSIWQNGGSLRNSGTLVNNGNMDLVDVRYVQSAEAAFTTYNAAGLNVVSGSMTVPSGAFFRNEGYMRVTDRYGADYAPCDLSGFEDFFTTWNQDGNDSNWCDVAAEVYDEAGYYEAVDAQNARPWAMRYNRLDFTGDVTFSSDVTFADFGSYWLQWCWKDTFQRWDEALEDWVDCGPEEEGAEYAGMIPVGVTLTIPEGVTLTVAHDNGVFVDGVAEMMAYFSPSTLKVLGTLVLEPGQEGTEENDWEWHDCGRVEIWSFGSFVNEGTVHNDGYFEIRYYDMGRGEESEEEGFVYIHEGRLERPEECVVIGEPENTVHAAEVRSIPALQTASAQDSGFGRILIREDCVLTLEEDLTVWADELDIDPGSGLIVPHGVTLDLMGHMWNDGDVSVYGDLDILGSLDSNQNLEVGSLTGENKGRILVDGYLQIRGGSRLTVYPTGSVLLRQGSTFDNDGDFMPVELEGTPGFVRRAILPGMTLDGEYSFRECEFTGDLILKSGGDGRYYGFDCCAFHGGVTLLYGEGDGGLTAEFFDNAWFDGGKKVLVSAEGVADLRELTDRIQIVGARALNITAEAPVNVGMFVEGSFLLNGVEAGFRGGDYPNGGCSIRFEGEGSEAWTVFQGDSDLGETMYIAGSLEGFDELRLMQGSFDITDLDTEGAVLNVDAPFGPTWAENGGHTADLWSEPDRGSDFRITAGPGATVVVHDPYLARDGEDWFGTWVTVCAGGEEFMLNPHIFGAHGGGSVPVVFVGSSDERLDYSLTFNGEGLDIAVERPVDGEDKTHLWPAGEGSWFTADQGEHPDLVLTVLLPGDVTVVFDRVPVKPED